MTAPNAPQRLQDESQTPWDAAFDRSLLIVAIAIPAVALLGWMLNVDVLRSWVPGFTPMNPTTAICTLILAALTATVVRQIPNWLFGAACAFVAAIALARLSDNLLGTKFGLDLIFLRSQMKATGVIVGVATLTAFLFLGLSSSLVFARFRRATASQLAGCLSGIVAFIVVLGYALTVFEGPMDGGSTKISFPTATSMMLLALMTVRLPLQGGPMEAFRGTRPHASAARRIVAFSVFAPALLSFFRFYGQVRLNLFDLKTGVLLQTGSTLAVLLATVWLVTTKLKRYSDQERELSVQLEEERRLFEQVLEAVPVGIALRNRDGDVVLSNKSYRDWQPDSLRTREKSLQTLQSASDSSNAPIRAIDTQGRERWLMQFRDSPDTTSGNQIEVVVDVTELHELEIAHRKTHERLQATVNSISEVVFSMTPDFKQMLFISGAAEETLGIASSALTMDPPALWSIAHPEDVNLIKEAVAATTVETPFDVSFRIKHPERGLRWLHSHANVVASSEGEPIRIDGTITDVTYQRSMETNLALARDAAVVASDAKSEFISRMSHELRTPLNAILGFSQLIELQSSDPKTLQSVTAILRAGKHLLQLINEMLDLSRIEAGRLSLSLEPVCVRAVASSAIEMVQPIAEQSKVKLELDTGGMEEIYARADRQRLAQVFVNLLSNAIKFNRENGTAKVRIMPVDDSTVRVEIEDTGIGIPESEAHRLFQPFERMANSQVEGTGLGLALSRKLMGLMGGSLNLVRTSAEGSVFAFDLQAANIQRDNGNRPQSDVPSLNPQRRSALVLYIEDNSSNIELVQSILADESKLDLMIARTGQEGLRAIHDRAPDVILLDLNLPDMSGDEVIRRLKSEPVTRDIPVIVVSADATDRQQGRLRELGAFDYITKPIDLNRFSQSVEKALHHRTGNNDND